MKPRPVVFIAHPYRGDSESNLAKMKEYVRAAALAGYAPIAPVLLYEAEGISHEIGIEMGLRLIWVCDEFWLCGETISPGMQVELNYAKEIGIPVRTVQTPQHA